MKRKFQPMKHVSARVVLLPVALNSFSCEPCDHLEIKFAERIWLLRVN